ncbi:hypothetical protein LXL04_022442 [Taraxacum kok-saghyz]
MTYHRSRSQNLRPAPSMAKLHCKLSRVVSRHDKLKLSFNHLKSQIKTGLLEAEDVFGSLAVPLMKLVGLKSAEMAEEGRSSTISLPAQVMYLTVVLVYFSISRGTDEYMIDTHKAFSTRVRENTIHSLEEEYTNSAMTAGKEIIQKQRLQLIQLLQVLKQVEICVNSSQKNMFQTIDDQKENIQTFVQKAATYVSRIQQSSHDGSAFTITLKLLKAIYEHICAVLSSVEGGVDNLVNKLTEQMAKPMMEYARSFKAEMTTGTCHHLLAALEDMKEVERDRRVELSQARKKVRVAEEMTLQVLSKLRESEERIKKMKQIIERQESSRLYHKHKNGQTKDEKLLWELLKMKQTCLQPKSPYGFQENLSVGTSTNHQKSTMVKPSITTRITRSTTKPKMIPLGPSPSVTTTTQALSRKHVAS